MTIYFNRRADKLYEIICKRYEKFCCGPWESCKVSVEFFSKGKEVLIKWHGLLGSHGIATSKNFVRKTGVVCVKDPAILYNEWIVMSDEVAMKILVLGELP